MSSARHCHYRKGAGTRASVIALLLLVSGCSTLPQGKLETRSKRAAFVVFDATQELPAWTVPHDANPQLRASLADADRILRALGGKSAVSNDRRIVLKRDPALSDKLPEGRGFVIDVQPKEVIVRATDDAGLSHGVIWMLQEWAGVRWFWPQPVGEVLPNRSELRLPLGRKERAPAYLSRDFYAAGPQPWEERWKARNLLEARYPHQHAMDRIFPVSLKAREPHLFPLIEGQRPRPERFLWQPNLAHPDARLHAAAVATGWLRLHPQAAGYSLSINDSMRFDEGQETAHIQQPMPWFRGRPDYSPLVFSFMNQVARQVPPEVLGDRTLNAYAYYWTENTPPFAVDPAVMPVLTADRFQYYDPTFRIEDTELLRRWGKSGARRLMLYEYLEGDAYLIPRQAPEALAMSIRKGHRAGARGYFAESRLWPGMDGPKSWIVAQLLWDPQLDVRALEREFAEGMFGKKAAKAYLDYLQIGEEIWMSQPGSARWLRGYHDEFQGMVVSYADRRRFSGAQQKFQQAVEWQAAQLERDGASESAKLLRARAGIVSRAHLLFEAFDDFYDARVKVAELDQKLHQQRDGQTIESLRFAAARHAALHQRIRNLIQHAVAQGEMNFAQDWATRTSPASRVAATLANWQDDPALALNDNPTLRLERTPRDAERARLEWFEQHAPVLPASWRMDLRPAQGFAIRAPQNAADGWTVESADGMRLHQRTPVTGGLRYRAAARVSGTLEFGTEVSLQLEFLDRHRRALGTSPQPDRMEPEVFHAHPRRLVVEGMAPEGTVWAAVSLQVRGQAPRQKQSAEPADSVEVHQLGLWLLE